MKKYVELYRKLKDEILSKKYSFGDKLESKRTMADKLGVSVITVEKAYSMLLDEGYIYARERSGYYVSELNGLAPLPTIERVKPPLLEEESEYEGEDFEYSVYIKTLRRVVSEKRERIFIKTSGKGCAALRNAISEYLFRYRGMYAPPQRIVIGSGSEQLYESIAARKRKAYRNRGSVVFTDRGGILGNGSEEQKASHDLRRNLVRCAV